MMAKLTAVGIALAVLACAHSGEAQYYQFGQLAYSQPYQAQQAGYPSVAGYQGGQGNPYIMQASWPQTVPRAGLDYDGGSQGSQSASLPRKCRRPDRALFGEFLYMRPRNAEVAFAVPINGAIAPPAGAQPIQVGETAVVDIDYSPGFRVGFRRSMDEWASVGIAYTHFESSTTYETTESRPNIVLRSLVTHPGAQAAPTDYLSASGRFDFDMDLADVDYRCVIAHGDRFVVDCLLGLRFAHLEQTFSSTFGGNGVEVVNSNVLFDGGGLRVGIIGERHACNSGFLVFGRGFVSLLAGEFRGTYLMGTGVDPVVAETRWKAGRLVPTIDLEVGMGWTSCNGRIRFDLGYNAGFWFNTVRTDEFIAAVQRNEFVGLGDLLTLDGFVGRAELRF